MSKHTPIPWIVQKPRGPQHAIDRKCEIVAPDPEGHGEMVIVGEHTGIECLTWDNAEFIVKAANCHDDLLDALDHCEKILNAWFAFPGDDPGRRAMAAVNKARAAIAKAEGAK